MNLQKIISLAALTATFALVGPSPGQAETTGSDPDAHVYIVSPGPDTYYPDAPVTIDVSVNVTQGDAEYVDSVELFVDDVSVGSQECFDYCGFTGIELDEGEHELRATGGSSTAVRIVYVGEEEPSDTGAETGVEAGEGDGDGDTSDGESGNGDESPMDDEDTGESGDGGSDMDLGNRGCSVDGSPSNWGLLALPMLLLLPAWRRRDRD